MGTSNFRTPRNTDYIYAVETPNDEFEHNMFINDVKDNIIQHLKNRFEDVKSVSVHKIDERNVLRQERFGLVSYDCTNAHGYCYTIDLHLTLEYGYYSGAQFDYEVDTYDSRSTEPRENQYFTHHLHKAIIDAYKTYTDAYTTAYRFSNGETGYEKVEAEQ